MQVRQLILGAVASLAVFSAAGSTAAQAAERLSLPFTCSVEGNAVRLKPGPLEELAIVGPRLEQVVMACTEGGTSECRTMVAHKFLVLCGGKRVSWAKVAEAVGGRRTSRVWRKGDQLHVALVQAAKPCSTASEVEKTNASPTSSAHCESSGAAELLFVMPADYAPVAHFGARITGSPNAADASQPGGTTENSQSSVAAAQPAQASRTALSEKLLARTIVTEPLPELRAGSRGQDVTGVPRGSVSDGKAGVDHSRLQTGGSDLAAISPTSRAAPNIGGTGRSTGENASGHVQQRNATSSEAPDGRPAPETMAWGATVISPDGPVETSALGEQSESHHNADAYNAIPTPGRIALLLLATVLLGSLGWMAWSRPDRVAAAAATAKRASHGLAGHLPAKDRAVRFASDAIAKTRATAAQTGAAAVHKWQQAVAAKPRKNAHSPQYPVAGVEEVCTTVDIAVRQVPQELPLRGVLNEELARVRERLSVARAAASGDGGEAQVPVAAYRVLMRDLDRIRRIAESAREGMAAETMAGVRMPRNREEAFDVLGLNPNAGDSTAKKVIDALRMSWHPDLAQSPDDLAVREERIKQINVASELISGKFANLA